MSLLVVIILGIVQGVAEFLPISSSSHVFFISRLLHSPSNFEFDVLVSFGTLLAVIIYFRKRFYDMVTRLYRHKDASLILKLVCASIPAGFAGFILKGLITTYLHGIVIMIIMLTMGGFIMVWSSRWSVDSDLPVNYDMHKITYRQAVLIGFSQCIALVSGVSRSGITILAAMGQGITTSVAAEWSFLMSVPIISGALLRVIVGSSGKEFISSYAFEVVIANIVSFVFGIMSINVLLKVLKSRGLYWFGWYRIALGAVLIVAVSAKLI